MSDDDGGAVFLAYLGPDGVLRSEEEEAERLRGLRELRLAAARERRAELRKRRREALAISGGALVATLAVFFSVEGWGAFLAGLLVVALAAIGGAAGILIDREDEGE